MNPFDYSKMDPVRLREIQASTLADDCSRYRTQGKLDEAIMTANEIDERFGQYMEIAVSKNVAWALVHKGLALGQQSKFDEAIACFDEVEKRYGQNQEPRLRELVAWALVSKGDALDQPGKLNNAIVCYDEVKKRFSEDTLDWLRELVAEALIKKGGVLSRQSKPDEAIACYDEAISHLSRHRFRSDQEWKKQELMEQALAHKCAINGVLCNYVFPFGCPDCSPVKSVTVEGFQTFDKTVPYTCCGKIWKVSDLNWEHAYSDGSKSSYSVTTCPKCHQDKAYYAKDSGKFASGTCKNCGHHIVERDDW